jgi:hypothetical protein
LLRQQLAINADGKPDLTVAVYTDQTRMGQRLIEVTLPRQRFSLAFAAPR